MNDKLQYIEGEADKLMIALLKELYSGKYDALRAIAITTSIMGVGCAKGFRHLKLSVVERILWAWVLTIPASALTAYLCVRAARALGWIT